MMTTPEETPRLSIVTAVLNEEESLELFCRRIKEVIGDREGLDYELIVTDDGSRDRTWEILTRISRDDPRVQGIRLSRNFGQHVALTAGLDRARGDYTVLMDADLQDRPEEIPRLLGKAEEGYEVVYARRKSRQDTFFKKFFSRSFYRVFNAISTLQLRADIGIFRILHWQVVENLRNFPEQSRLLIGLIDWMGFGTAWIEVDRPGREHGETKYGWRKMIRLALDALTAFSVLPLRIAVVLGLAISLISFVLGLIFLYMKLYRGIGLLGWPSMITSLFFLGGTQLLMIGVLGEYVGKIFLEVKHRPLYVVRETLSDGRPERRKQTTRQETREEARVV